MKEFETSLLRGLVYTVFVTVLSSLAIPALAHSPNVDGFVVDWCTGSASYLPPAQGGMRMEDTAATLQCGECSVADALARVPACLVNTDCPAGGTCLTGSCSITTDKGCLLNTDCPAGETCNPGIFPKSEIVWWDNRTDGAVNDLGTVAFTWNNEFLFVGAELWVDPDPVSLPFGMIAFDYAPGGLDVWHDDLGALTQPGHCSTFTDRACTKDADCHFCQLSTEPFPSMRVRTCGSACDPGIGDVCEMDQTCVNIGTSPIDNIGQCAVPGTGKADYLLVFDFGIWLATAGSIDHAMLVEPRTGNAFPPPWNLSPWTPVTGCTPDGGDPPGQEDWCDVNPKVNPGASGGSGGPPGSVEAAIPWSAFGCTGCPGACVCPGMGPGVPFRFTMAVGRGELVGDFKARGAHEDLISAPAAGNTTTSSNDCASFGIGNTICELSDRTSDAWVPRMPLLAHETVAGGRTACLTADKAGAQISLDWAGSCSGGDNDFGVYEGAIGSWASHVPVACSTAGLTTTTFAPAAPSSYYLVVPTDGISEGSYGASDFTMTGERVPSAAACSAQSLGMCF